MKHIPSLFALLALILVSGCYHARIETGLTPGTQVYDQPWALGFVYGLIPPSTVEAGEECPGGVAVVETELSFLNQLVSAITFGLVTPMHIKVTCAAGGGVGANDAGQVDGLSIREGAPTDEVVQTFGEASDLAAETGEPVYVRFE